VPASSGRTESALAVTDGIVKPLPIQIGMAAMNNAAVDPGKAP
jgi:hypothetical protein